MPTPKTPPPQGLFGLPDIGSIIDQVTNALPDNVADAIKNTVGGIVGDGPINIGDPQPPGEPPIPVTPGSGPMAAAIRALDVGISAIDAILKLGFLIPDDIGGVNVEEILRKVEGALKTVRSWLD